MIKSLQKQQKKYIYDQGFQLGVCRPMGVPIGIGGGLWSGIENIWIVFFKTLIVVVNVMYSYLKCMFCALLMLLMIVIHTFLRFTAPSQWENTQ